MYKSLKALGYDDVSISGIIGNAITESSLNPDSISGSKTYHGLFQNDKNIRKAVEDMYGDYSLKSQMKYAHDWVTGAKHIKGNKYTTTNAGTFKRTGYKDVNEASDAWSHLYERAIIKDKNGNVIGYQKDPERRANAIAAYDYINNTYNGGPKVIKTDSGKKMIIPLSTYEKPTEFESTWKPEPPVKTIYPLNNTTPESISSWSGADAPNATPRVKDFNEAQNEAQKPVWDAFERAQTIGHKSPFSLSLSLPKLDNLLALNTPQRQMQEDVADILGISDMLPQTPSLFPRLKNGKLPRYEHGKGDGYKYSWNSDNRSWDRYTNDPYAEAFNNIVVTPKTNRERFNYEKQPLPLRTPNTESDQAYTQRRIEETTKNSTPISDAINLGVSFIPGVGDARDAIAAGVAGVKGDYTTAGLLGAGLLLPNVAKSLYRRVSKPIKRYFSWPVYTYNSKSGLAYGESEFADKFASRIADSWTLPTKEEKKQFNNLYKQSISRQNTVNTDIDDYMIGIYAGNKNVSRDQYWDVYDMLYKNPEYGTFLLKNKIKDPLNQSSVDQFLKQQFTSLRGVHAKSKDDAIRYLTHVEEGRHMPGNDRLGTNGGLYTSNSPNVADRFKNPEYGTEDGYIAKVVYPHNIRRDIPIEDQLEQYRKMVFPAGDVHPMYGTSSYFKELEQAKKGGSIALEADYVGRAANGVPGQERAYLPYGSGSHPVVTIESLDYYPNQINKAGRWGYGMQAGNTEGLFIPRRMNSHSDYIRAAKAFLSPKKVRNQEEYSRLHQEARALWDSQSKKRDDLVYKLHRRKSRDTALFSIAGATGLIGAGVYKVDKDAREFDEFWHSEMGQQFRDDPRYKEYLDRDDDSFDRLERAYLRKYKLQKKGKSRMTE